MPDNNDLTDEVREGPSGRLGTLPSFDQALVLTFFLVTPLTWSYLFIARGLAIRLHDVFLLMILVRQAARSKFSLDTWTIAILLCFVLLSAWEFAIGLINNDPGLFVNAAKKFYLVAGSISVCLILYNAQQHVTSRVFCIFAIVIFGAIFGRYVFSANHIYTVFDHCDFNSPGTKNCGFLFWKHVFDVNIFGADRLPGSLGASFRNSMAAGLVAILCYYCIHVRRSHSHLWPIIFLLCVILLSISRSAWLAGAVFVMIVALSLRWRRKYIVVLLCIALGVFFAAELIGFHDALLVRLHSRFGRFDLYREGLRVLLDNMFIGTPDEVFLLGDGHDIELHGVHFRIGARTGLLGFALTVAISLLCVYRLFEFIKTWLYAADFQTKIQCAGLITAAFVLVLRPIVSSSSETFFSIGGWACFALVACGLGHVRK